MKTALVIAGGGQYGIGPATIASHMDANGLWPDFDFGVGTSVGALLLLEYALGKRPGEVKRFFIEQCPRIFGSKRLAGRLGFGAKYDDSYINALLKKECGDRLVGDTKFPCNFVAWDSSSKKMKFWDGKDKYPLWKAVRSSMAAPTYFEQVDGLFWDGGLGANYPAVHAMAALRHRFRTEISEMRILGLVTSGLNPDTKPIGTGCSVLSIAKNIVIPAVTTGNSADQEFICNALMAPQPGSLGSENYLHVQPACKNYELDDVPLKDIEFIWMDWFVNNYDRIGQWSGIWN